MKVEIFLNRLLQIGVCSVLITWGLTHYAEAAELPEGPERANEIQSGFVFIDGRYIESPYVVTRKSFTVLVNGTPAKSWNTPSASASVPQTDPGQPSGLTQTNTLDDIRRSHAYRKYLYVHDAFTGDVAVKKMMDYYQALPFVESVKLMKPSTPSILRVRMKNGQEELIDISAPSPESALFTNVTTNDYVARIERYKRRIEKRLQKGDTLFFFANGMEISFGHDKATKDIGLVVDILSSQKTKGEKISLLRRLTVLPPHSTEEGEVLVKNFRVTDQLRNRINELVENSGTRPRGYSDIPSESPFAQEKSLRQKR